MNSARTHFSQLPDSSELTEIMSKEAQRPLAAGKENVHYATFETFIAILDHYAEPTDLFIKDLTAEEVLSNQLLEAAHQLCERLTIKILADTNPPIALFDAYYEYLSVKDAPEPSDLMFIFGSMTLLRVEHAAKLFHEGYAPKILISGAGPHYETSEISEAEKLARHIETLGVPREALILEEKAITIADNARRSLNLLDDLAFPYTSLLLVNSPYSQRRGLAHFQKLLPDTIKLSTANAKTRLEYARNEWYKYEIGTKIVLNEAIKLKTAVSLNSV